MNDPEWTRCRGQKLVTISMQAGLSPEEAESALIIGARFVARGFSDEDVRRMEQDYYRQRREAYERWGL